jgi:hypothetical protein
MRFITNGGDSVRITRQIGQKERFNDQKLNFNDINTPILNRSNSTHFK